MMASLAFNDLVLMNLQKMKIKIKMSEKFKSTFNKDIVLSGTISLNWLFTVFFNNFEYIIKNTIVKITLAEL